MNQNKILVYPEGLVNSAVKLEQLPFDIVYNKTKLSFHPNGEIHWNDRKIETDIELVTALRNLIFKDWSKR